MRKILTICAVAAIVCSAGLAQAALWEIQDAGLQDSVNFVNTGQGTPGASFTTSDIAGDPGTRFNITLAAPASGTWTDITIGDDFDLPAALSGLAAATGNSGNLSAYAGYAMTIRNPGSKAFMVALSMNTGWTDMSEPDNYYQNGDGSVKWVGPGDTVTITLDFKNAALWNGSGYTTGSQVLNLNHVTNISIKIGSNTGQPAEVGTGAFDLDVTSRTALWEIKDAGLQDETNFVNTTAGSDGVLNSRTDIASDPGYRFNITLSKVGGGWTDITIGDDFDLPSALSGIAAATGNSGDLSGYIGYAMTIHNPGDKAFMAALSINTGWTDISEPDSYYQNGDGSVKWVGPGDTVTLTLDFDNAALWSSGWVTGQTVLNLNHVTNISVKIGANLGNDGEIESGTAFDVDVVSNVLELNPATLYIKTNQSLTTDMDVKNLMQRVNACQAMLGYSSTYFNDPTGGCVAAGGGVWDLVIWDSWFDATGTTGEIDTAIGVDAYGSTGTDADGTVAKITLTSGASDGTTQIVFRADVTGDDTKQTLLSDMYAQKVWPMKYDTQNIVIDGTDPNVDDISAKQGGPELTPCSSGNIALQGQVDILVTVSDNLAGIAAVPTVTVTDAASNVTDITSTGSDNGGGVYSYTYQITSADANGCATIDVTVTDKSGNSASGSDGFVINKNEISGNVSMVTFSVASYSFSRNVVFTATDSGDSVIKIWNVPVSFVNNTTTKIAAGTYKLTDVPGNTANLSAKTAWSLRQRQAVSFDSENQAVNNFNLLGGDMNNSNSVNIFDYSTLKVNWYTTNAVADINGDGQVQLLDYSIMKSNWFKTGDAQ